MSDLEQTAKRTLVSQKLAKETPTEKAFGFVKNTSETGPGAKGMGDAKIGFLSQSWWNANNTQGGTAAGGNKVRPSIYADVPRL